MPEATVIPLDGGSEGGPRRRRARPAPADVAPVESAGTGQTSDLERKLASGLAFLRRRISGDFPVDDFGFDPDLTDSVVLPALRPVYEKYFRIEVRGMENVPLTGGTLIVANHSGTIPIDSAMTGVALHDHHPAKRHLRMLAADLVFTMPIVAPMARKAGATLACNEDAERLMKAGELVGVWPEGFKGIGKPYRERYKLQRFGRGGFVSAALRSGVPIIPCSIVGAEEIYPLVGNVPALARALGLPYLPITPFFPLLGPLGMIPLPSKWIIEFGEPIETDKIGPEGADDPMLVFNLTDQVREVIQQTLYKLLLARKSVFF
ncbi:MAG TPA: lysophospholipid acyltransferase family protein [Mycobacteriales bacterium]|nr:lysophospholipid acyltransferase family protein [Mycobacteriales bacterium]